MSNLQLRWLVDFASVQTKEKELALVVQVRVLNCCHLWPKLPLLWFNSSKSKQYISGIVQAKKKLLYYSIKERLNTDQVWQPMSPTTSVTSWNLACRASKDSSLGPTECKAEGKTAFEARSTNQPRSMISSHATKNTAKNSLRSDWLIHSSENLKRRLYTVLAIGLKTLFSEAEKLKEWTGDRNLVRVFSETGEDMDRALLQNQKLEKWTALSARTLLTETQLQESR